MTLAAAVEAVVLVVTAATAEAAAMAVMKIRVSSKTSSVTGHEAPRPPFRHDVDLTHAGYGVCRLPYLCDRLRLMRIEFLARTTDRLP